jgi:hypothetical protein
MKRAFGAGDDIGQRTVLSFYNPDHRSLGILVSPGDRVQLRRDRPSVQGAVYGAWGTVLRGRGFGNVSVQLDSGPIFNVRERDLEFAKQGRPPLPAPEVRS